MASIGSVTVEFLRGNRFPQSTRIDLWFVPGRTGPGAQDFGSNQSAFRYRAILYGSDAANETRLVALAALRGTIVSIEDDFEEVRGGNLIVSVGVPSRRRVISDGVEAMRAEVLVEGVVTT